MSETTKNNTDTRSVREMETREAIRRLMKRVGKDYEYVDQAIQKSKKDDWYLKSAHYWSVLLESDTRQLVETTFLLRRIVSDAYD